MTQKEFRSLFEKEIPMYRAWGNFVTRTVIEHIPQNIDIDMFFKIPPKPRVKSLNSLIEKAFYRKDKNYTDPYAQITDKVGTRFVVLLESEIEILKDIICKIPYWEASLDKDYEDQQFKSPTVFEYQSVHYVVKSTKNFEYEDVIIKERTPCEIQIRTLLQHAYSELTHDTIYKPTFQVPDKVHRLVARSMALIETTNELFDNVKEAIMKKYQNDYEFLNILNNIYSQILTPDISERLNITIYDAVKDINNQITPEILKDYLYKHPEIEIAIKKGYQERLLYRQPVILLLSFLAKENRSMLRNKWPYTEEELAPLFADLGICPYTN